MSFKYYPNPSPPSSASSVLVDQFQALLLDQFKISTDNFDILEESVFASGSYTNINVRITSAIDPSTQTKRGDDWKRILFKDINHPVSVGMKYSFNDNIWIVINQENIKSLTSSATVRRANNVLRWIDPSSGSLMEEACSIEYDYKNPKDSTATNAFIIPGAYTRIYSQLNSKTRTISDNQRFLFGNTGNWNCFKVFGNGTGNAQNLKTTDNNSAQLLTLEVGSSFINEDTDDIVNGIADRYRYSTSASSVANIVVSPNDGKILELSSQTFDVRYYSGSVVTTGSFVFSISGSNVPVANYTFGILTDNTFSITNNEKYLDSSLIVNCIGTSGSRAFEVSLAGSW
jgi:hypothetical protein